MKGYKKSKETKFVNCAKCNTRLIRRYATISETRNYTPFDWYCFNCNKTILDSDVEIVDLSKKRKDKLNEKHISKGVYILKGYKPSKKSKFVYCVKCNNRLVRRYIKSTITNNYTPFDWSCIICNETILDSQIEIVVVSKQLQNKQRKAFENKQKKKSKIKKE